MLGESEIKYLLTRLIICRFLFLSFLNHDWNLYECIQLGARCDPALPPPATSTAEWYQTHILKYVNVEFNGANLVGTNLIFVGEVTVTGLPAASLAPPRPDGGPDSYY